MATTVRELETTEHIAPGRLWRAGLVTLAGAIGANLILWAIAQAMLNIPPEFAPLATPAAPIIFTTLGVVGADLVLALVAQFTQRPITVFRIVAVVVLILSLLPNVGMMLDPSSAQFPGATTASAFLLALMHLPPSRQSSASGCCRHWRAPGNQCRTRRAHRSAEPNRTTSASSRGPNPFDCAALQPDPTTWAFGLNVASNRHVRPDHVRSMTDWGVLLRMVHGVSLTLDVHDDAQAIAADEAPVLGVTRGRPDE